MTSRGQVATKDRFSARQPLRAFHHLFHRSSNVSDAANDPKSTHEHDEKSPNYASVINQSRSWLQSDPSLCQLCRSITVQGLKSGFKHRRVQYFHDEFFRKQGPYSGPIEDEENQYPIALIHEASQCRLCAIIWQTMTRKVSSIFKDLKYWRVITQEPNPESSDWVLQRQVYLFWVPSIPDFGCPTVDVKIEGEREMNYFGRFAFLRSVGLVASSHAQHFEWPIQLDPMARGVWDWVKARIHQCQSSHTQCSSSAGWNLPSRLVHVGTSRNPVSRLCETKEWHSNSSMLRHGFSRKSYVALSYCWGMDPVFRTMPANLEQMKKAIPEHELPQTIQDAMTVTRNLGFEYLWVDSLCILQGNSEIAKKDWTTEAARMADVYSGAILTICAASPTGANEGFLHTRPTLDDIRPVKLPLIDDYVASFNRLDQAIQEEKTTPLHKRAWTLQEYLLSKRILIYGRGEVTWKCQEHNERESGLKTDAGLFLTDWESVIMNYSARLLTVESDRLVAISGVAAAKFPDRGLYLSGAWSETLLVDLTWCESDYIGKIEKVARKLSNVEGGAPSWSWASHMAQVSFFSNPRREHAIEISVMKHLQLSHDCYRDEIYGPYSVLEVVSGLVRTNMATLLSFPPSYHHEKNPRWLSLRLDFDTRHQDNLTESEKGKYLNSEIFILPIYQDTGIILTMASVYPIGLLHKYLGTDLQTLKQVSVNIQTISRLPQLQRIGSYRVHERPFYPDWSSFGSSLGPIERFLLV